MKYLKSYESLQTPQIGDWVILTHWWCGQHLHKYVDTTPAQITNIKDDKDGHIQYWVKYPSKPGNNIRFNLYGIDEPDEPWIKEFSTTKGFQNLEHWVKYIAKTKEEINIYLDAEKYNI